MKKSLTQRRKERKGKTKESFLFFFAFFAPLREVPFFVRQYEA
jgi:hypothetical protein